MKAQRREVAVNRDAAMLQVACGQCACDGSPHGKQPLRCARCIAPGRRCVLARRFGWQVEEAARFGDGLFEGRQIARQGDEVEQVAVFAGGGVGPLAGALAGKPHIQAASWRVGDIAGMPVAAAALAVAEIFPANGLGVQRQSPREFGNRLARRVVMTARHPSRSLTRRSVAGWRLAGCRDRSRPPAPWRPRQRWRAAPPA